MASDKKNRKDFLVQDALVLDPFCHKRFPDASHITLEAEFDRLSEVSIDA